MIRSKTVFVIGAGASRDLGFPGGPELLQNIVSAFDIHFDQFTKQPKSGDRTLLEAIKIKTGGRVGFDVPQANLLLQAGRRIMRSSAGGDSIDNVIDQADDEPLVAEAGKLAIALQILRAEAASKLASAKAKDSFSLDDFSDTWLYGFVRLIRVDTRKSKLETMFENVSVITFNYDRTLEYFLPLALRQVYDLTPAEAARYAGQLPVFHPYGMVGKPVGEAGLPGSVPFGSIHVDDIPTIADSLVTFGERVEQNEEVLTLKSHVAQARHVVFLGFGFHRQNMALITPDDNVQQKRLFGTTLGLSGPARQEVTRMVTGIAVAGGKFLPDEISLPNSSCTELLSDYFLPLTG